MKLKNYIVIILSLLAVAIMVGCNAFEKDDDPLWTLPPDIDTTVAPFPTEAGNVTDEPIVTAAPASETASETEVPTATIPEITSKPTDDNGFQSTGKLNPPSDSSSSIPPEKTSETSNKIGNVTYVKKITEKYNGVALAESDYGKLMSSKNKAVSLIGEVKSGNVTLGTINCSIPQKAIEKEGYLCIPYLGKAENFIDTSKAVTWTFEESAFNDSFIQTEINTTIKVFSADDKLNSGAFLHIFQEDTYTRPDVCPDGLTVGFNPQSGNVTAFIPSDKKDTNWSTGRASVNVPDIKDSKEFKLNVTVFDKKIVRVAVNYNIIMTIYLNDGTFEILDGDGKSIGTGKYTPSLMAGELFSVFTMNGGIKIADLEIMGGYKTADKETVKTVEAIPDKGTTLGLDITNKTDMVGICYSLWFNMILGDGTGPVSTSLNVTELTEKYGFSHEEGFGQKNNRNQSFYYWAEPAQGYYRSTDPVATRNNLKLIADAGVDFIVVDWTFASKALYGYGTREWDTAIYGPAEVLLDTVMDMRANGEKAPYVVFWPNNDEFFGDLKTYILNVEKWKDCFVYWDNNPFVIIWKDKTGLGKYDGITFKKMCGFARQNGVYTDDNSWSYLEVDNLETASATHMTACVATQESYMSETRTAHGRNNGKFWYSQWKNVFQKRPKIVTVTWWNEWAAQLLIENGRYQFTDNFNQEYSRDIEPMKGGHGDQYYKWLCSYVAAYKAHKPCPENYLK